MAKILVHREGQQMGPYEMEEIRQFLYSGRLRDTDLAWQEGTPEWVRISSLLRPASHVPVSPAPAQTALVPAAWHGSEVSGLAIASLVLGILSLLGGTVFTGVPGVICGHLATAKIRLSGGVVAGEGLALAGLITNYLAVGLTLLLVVGLLLFFALPLIIMGLSSASLGLLAG